MKRALMIAAVTLLSAGCAQQAEATPPVRNMEQDAAFISQIRELPSWGSDQDAIELADTVCTAFDTGVPEFKVHKILEEKLQGSWAQVRQFQTLAVKHYCPRHAGL